MTPTEYREYRIKVGLKQSHLAKALNMSVSAINERENGKGSKGISREMEYALYWLVQHVNAPMVAPVPDVDEKYQEEARGTPRQGGPQNIMSMTMELRSKMSPEEEAEFLKTWVVPQRLEKAMPKFLGRKPWKDIVRIV